MMKRVTADVMDETDGTQRPQQLSQMQREFYFNLSGTTYLEIDNATGDGPFHTETLVNDANGGESHVADVTGSFTVPAGVTDLNLIVRLRSTSNGGASDGGDPFLSRLAISQL